MLLVFESRDEKMQAIMDNIAKSGMSVEELTRILNVEPDISNN